MSLWEVKKISEKKITKKKDGAVQTEIKLVASLQNQSGLKMSLEISEEDKIQVGDMFKLKQDTAQTKITAEV